MRLLNIWVVLFCCTCSVFAWDNAPEKPWDRLDDCRLVDSFANDGDSFHVMHVDKEYVFRLCFVDCPETSDYYKDRIQQQSDWWGITTKNVVRAGKDATEFTMKLLGKSDFVVYTKHKDARGNSKLGREFAMIKVGDSYLSEILVENGFARVYGYAVKTPDGVSRNTYRNRLDSIEKKAKRERKGAWKYAKKDFIKESKQINAKVVDAGSLTLTALVSFYYDDYSAGFRGNIKEGSVVYILDKSDKHMIKVRAPFRGSMVAGQCRRYDLSRMMKK